MCIRMAVSKLWRKNSSKHLASPCRTPRRAAHGQRRWSGGQPGPKESFSTAPGHGEAEERLHALTDRRLIWSDTAVPMLNFCGMFQRSRGRGRRRRASSLRIYRSALREGTGVGHELQAPWTGLSRSSCSRRRSLYRDQRKQSPGDRAGAGLVWWRQMPAAVKNSSTGAPQPHLVGFSSARAYFRATAQGAIGLPEPTGMASSRSSSAGRRIKHRSR